MRPTVSVVECVDDAIEAARKIQGDLADTEEGEPVPTWSLKRTLARANKIARWASAELKGKSVNDEPTMHGVKP
jgi:hypothetical protein